jgi:hypothetical protein
MPNPFDIARKTLGALGKSAGKPLAQLGEGLRGYHGTATQFEQFDPKFLGSVSDTSDAMHGFWCSSERARAEQAARDAMAASGAKVPYVKDVELNFQNPLVVPSIRGQMPEDIAALAQRARTAGHDGIIFKEGEQGGSDYLALDPSRIGRSR